MTDDLTLDDLPEPAYEGSVSTDALSVDGENPNEQNDATFGLLCDRMRDRGWLGGPIVTDTDGLIADGEHRWRAAQEIGLSEVPVRQFDFDDADRRMVRQELNKISGEHDPKRDALEYDHLLSNGKSEEVNALVDAAEEDLDELLASLRVDDTTPVQYDYDPDHNVYFEDCVEGMRERLDDDSVDMVFTSLPYNVGKTAHGTRTTETVDYEDDRTDEEFREFLSDVFHELARVVKPTGHIFVNIQNHLEGGNVTPSTYICDLMPVEWRSFVVWHKPNGAQGMLHLNSDGRFYDTWEPIYHFSEDPNALNGTHNYGVWSVETEPFNEETEEHPAPFPVRLVEPAIDATTSPDDLILDPFMGSGTTAVAAIQSNRSYIGFELDEEGAYQPIIERRIGEAKRQRNADVNQSSETDDATAADD